MNRSPIPTAALLGLSFTACNEDPIVGTWEAVQVDQQGYPIVQMDDQRHSTEEIELVIASDLSATFTTREHVEFAGGEELHETSYDGDIAARGDGSYQLSITQAASYSDSGYDTAYYGAYAGPEVEFRGFAAPRESTTLKLDCVLSEAELTCTAKDLEETRFRFKKR